MENILREAKCLDTSRNTVQGGKEKEALFEIDRNDNEQAYNHNLHVVSESPNAC